ncbi:MAG: protein phosphatase 2C domain-containing protein [Armatimonas sp.]
MNATLTYRLAARTDVGLKRSVNEDNFGVFEIPGVDIAFVVCDGMGGLKAGDVASAEATRTIESSLRESLTAGDEPTAALSRALRRANDTVCRLPRPGGGIVDDPTVRPGSSAREAAAVIGTTAVAGVVKDGQLHLAHAGDSRAYRLRGERLERLTDDHSFVAEQVRAGNMTEAEARKSRFRNMITRAVGIDPMIQPDFRSIELAQGDLILVCSDGLTTLIEDPDIEEHMLSPRFSRQSLEQQVQSLIDIANRAGGTDNTTILLLKVFGDGEAPALSSTAIGPAPQRRDPSALLTQDVDEAAARNPRRRVAPSPVVSMLAFAGGAALVALVALLALPAARKAVGTNLLLMNGVRIEQLTPTPPPPTLQEDMQYDKPVEFNHDEIARGDILHYEPARGLYFVTKSTGQGRWLNKLGKVIGKSAAPSLPELPISDDIIRARFFSATDALGNTYISRPAQKKIEKFDARGGLRTTIKEGLQNPEAIAVDEVGNIYVVDYNTIKVISAKSKLIGPAPKKKSTGP